MDTETIENTEVELTTPEKTEVLVNKVDDFWSQHNLGTRLSIGTFLLAYLITLITSFFTDVPQYVLDTTGWLLFSAFLTVSLGINGVKEIGKIIIASKTGKF